eukprot:4979909-Prymnesium_polylepis.1
MCRRVALPALLARDAGSRSDLLQRVLLRQARPNPPVLARQALRPLLCGSVASRGYSYVLPSTAAHVEGEGGGRAGCQ